MLTTLRGAAGTWLVKILFVILILSFGAWGLSDFTSPGGVRSDMALSINGQNVDMRTLDQAFQSDVRRMGQAFGATLSIDQARQIGLLQQTIQRFIDDALVQQMTGQLQLGASDNAVRAAIRNDPSFQGEDGQYIQSRFEALLTQAGLTEAQYVETVRAQLIANALSISMSQGGTASRILAERLYAHENEKRRISLITLPADQFGTVPAPSHEELETFYRENESLFQTPTYRKINYLNLSLADIAKDIAVSPEELQQEYEARLPEFSTPPKAKLAQILVQDAAQAQTIMDAVKAGSTLTEAAQAQNGGALEDLGWLGQDELLETLAEPVFALNVGEIGGPFETPLGFHIFQLHERAESQVKTLEDVDVKEQLTQNLAQNKAVDVAVDLSNTLNDLLAGGATLEDAGRDMGLEVFKIAGLAQDGTEIGSGNVITGDLPGRNNFTQVAFKTAKGDSSSVIETEEGDYFVLHVEDIIAPELKPLEQVRDDVEKALMLNRQEDAGKIKANALVEKAQRGTLLEVIAQEEGLPYKPSSLIARRNTDEKNSIPPALAEEIFKIKVGDVVMMAAGEDFLIAKLNEIQPIKIENHESDIAQRKDQISLNLQQDFRQQFLTALRAQAEININYDLINKYYER